MTSAPSIPWASAARSPMEITLGTQNRIGVPAWAAAATARYTDRDRCPADDGRSG